MSAAAFARSHSINYTTFCSWRNRRTLSKLSSIPNLVEVELSKGQQKGLVVDLGGGCLLGIDQSEQVSLASALIRQLRVKV